MKRVPIIDAFGTRYISGSELLKLKKYLEESIKGGISTKEIEEDLDAWYAGRGDIIEVIRRFYVKRR